MTKKENDVLLDIDHKLTSLCTTVMGNGGKGHEQRIEDLEEVFPNLVTKDDCNDRHGKEKDRKRSRWLVAKDVMLIIIATISVLVALGAL